MKRLLFAALLLSSCATTAPPDHEHTVRTTPDVGRLPSPGVATYKRELAAADSHDSAVTSGDIAVTRPGALSGIGRLFSTPEGSARRQARKDAAAAVPKKLGKGAVYAPNNSGQVSGGNKTGPTAQAADSASANLTAIGKNKAPNASAPNATATETTEKAGWPWWSWLVLLGAEELITWLAFRMTVLSFLGGLFRRRAPIQPLSPDNGQPS